MHDLLEGVEVIWARPEAIAKLADVAERTAPLIRLGAALALGMPGETKTEVNADEWRVQEHDGLLVVSSVADRAATFDRAPTGVRGRVSESDGRLYVEVET